MATAQAPASSCTRVLNGIRRENGFGAPVGSVCISYGRSGVQSPTQDIELGMTPESQKHRQEK